MEKLDLCLKKTINKMGFSKRIKEEMALCHWEEAAGPQVMEHTRLGEIKGGVLFVYVKNSHWSQHLSFFKSSLLNKLNHKIGEALIKDIYFKVSPLAHSKIEKKEIDKNEVQLQPDYNNITLVVEETIKIEETVKELKDIYFKEKIQNMMIKFAKESSLKKEQGWYECMDCGALFYPGEMQKKCPVCLIKK
ncbi:DUF721 domain-containing protein [Candidatus Contubernalis alkaliaceticus]|uniref:DUF721 domain-containing protein n=1 Tax=Candidatus Contubernalis alkaliaceticus TaxID=338645 RepID=UPI001F4BDB3A|nr:DUF721 domain-containing protein [Candidatus Contubernalis alkalaceticus]UNC90615.1 DUF721 domain-containing protein [Candidatus Contubernalis alkalaceticus]